VVAFALLSLDTMFLYWLLIVGLLLLVAVVMLLLSGETLPCAVLVLVLCPWLWRVALVAASTAAVFLPYCTVYDGRKVKELRAPEISSRWADLKCCRFAYKDSKYCSSNVTSTTRDLSTLRVKDAPSSEGALEIFCELYSFYVGRRATTSGPVRYSMSVSSTDSLVSYWIVGIH
jgi:hypothetical protein